MTLDERIEAAAAEWWRMPPNKWSAQSPEKHEIAMRNIMPVLRAFAPELFTDPPTAWIAPWEATEAMQYADVSIAGDVGYMTLHPGELERAFAAMRDAHLNRRDGE